MAAVIDPKALEELGKEFLDRTKERLKDYWDTYPEQVKDDIKATANLAVRLSADLVVGDKTHYDEFRPQLDAQIRNFEVVGSLQFKNLVAEALADAAALSGSFLRKAAIAFITGGFKL